MKWIVLTAAALLTAGELRAHDFWIEPSTFHPEHGQTVSVGLRVGQDFIGDPVPRTTMFIDRFFVRQGGHRSDIDGVDGSDPAGFLTADGAAPAVIGYESKPSKVELPPAKFEAYLRQYGLESIIDARTKRGERNQPGREIFSRCAKAILTGSRASIAVTQPVGLRYEIVPSVDPTHDRGDFRGRLVFEGTPLRDALLVAVFRDAPSLRLITRSDGAGAFAFKLPRSGVWLIKSVRMIDAPRDSGAEWQSLWASLTFDTLDKR